MCHSVTGLLISKTFNTFRKKGELDINELFYFGKQFISANLSKDCIEGKKYRAEGHVMKIQH